MSRLLLVEGIPGAGKSTTARRLAELLRQRGQRCALFLEGDPQPADLAWQWWLTTDEFAGLLRRWPQAADTLRDSAWQGRAGVSVAYARLDRERFGSGWAELERLMEGREPFNGVLAPETFVAILSDRWSELNEDEVGRPGFVVLESALLQDTLVELVLFAQWPTDRIVDAVGQLLRQVVDLSPLVLRLVTEDPAATVAAAAAARVDEHGHPWWQEASRTFTAETPWARSRGLTPADALHAYLIERLGLEDQLRAVLPTAWVELTSPAGGAGDWAAFEADLGAFADRLVDHAVR